MSAGAEEGLQRVRRAVANRDRAAAALQSEIIDAYLAGAAMTAIGEAASLTKQRVWQIIRDREAS